VSLFCSLKSLDLSGVSWTCDCTIEDTLEWLQTTKISLIGYQKYECAEPNSKKNVLLSELNLDGEKCNAEIIMEKTIILIIIGCTSFVILVVAAIVFWQHRWRLKKKLKKQHYRCVCSIKAEVDINNVLQLFIILDNYILCYAIIDDLKFVACFGHNFLSN